MIPQAIKHITGERPPATSRKNSQIYWLYARRLMLSISLIAFSPESLLTLDDGQVNWFDKAQASGGNTAQSFDSDPFTDLAPLQDNALQGQRGGFSVAGFEIDVGIIVSTAINGILEVSSKYSLNSAKGQFNLGREIKNLTRGLSADITGVAKAAATGSETGSAVGSATDSDLRTANTSYVTATVSAPENSEVPAPIVAEISHQIQGGHVTFLTNRLNDVSIKQSVSMNITMENFSQVRAFSRIQQDMSALARQIRFLR